MTQEDRILGIDYGLKRVGIALSAPLNMFAQPHTTLANNGQLMAEIGEIVKEYSIGLAVIGLPYRTQGGKHPEIEKIKTFAKALEAQLGLTVAFEDERYTSVIANQALVQQNAKASYNKGLVDQTAAALILQAYLDKNR